MCGVGGGEVGGLGRAVNPDGVTDNGVTDNGFACGSVGGPGPLRAGLGR